MEPTQCSETSAFNAQTAGKYPEDNLSLLQHGESLKTSFEDVLVAMFKTTYDSESHDKLSRYHFQLQRIVLSNHIFLQNEKWLLDSGSLKNSFSQNICKEFWRNISLFLIC